MDSAIASAASGEARAPSQGRVDSHFLANLLLKLPYRHVLNAVLTLCDSKTFALFATFLSLGRQGFAFPFGLAIDRVDRVDDCPRLCPLRRGELGGWRLPCGHSFHEPCLRVWFEARKNCPSCRESVVPSGDPTEPSTPSDRLNTVEIKLEIMSFLEDRHSEALAVCRGHVADAFVAFKLAQRGVDPGETPKISEHFEEVSMMSDLLLKLPYRPVLNAVVTLYERDNPTLIGIVANLSDRGVPFDVASTLPEADAVADCPHLDPLRGRPGERGRALPCGHTFHETCLRYWTRIRKKCPACEREVECPDGERPPLQPEEDYARRDLDGVTVSEMLEEVGSVVDPKYLHRFVFKSRLTRD